LVASIENTSSLGDRLVYNISKPFSASMGMGFSLDLLSDMRQVGVQAESQ
jgi:hypothetical protein